MIRLGDSGSEVRDWTAALRASGFALPLASDFDATTDHATRAYQASRAIDVDGIVGPITWEHMNNDAPPSSSAPVPAAMRVLSQWLATAEDHNRPHRTTETARLLVRWSAELDEAAATLAGLLDGAWR